MTQPVENDALGYKDTQDRFEPAYVPPLYAPPRPDVVGVWRTVLHDDVEVAVVYTDYLASAGIDWVQQPAEVTGLYEFFIRMKMADVQPGAAYEGALATPGIQFGPEESGPMSELDNVRARLVPGQLESVT